MDIVGVADSVGVASAYFFNCVLWPIGDLKAEGRDFSQSIFTGTFKVSIDRNLFYLMFDYTHNRVNINTLFLICQ